MDDTSALRPVAWPGQSVGQGGTHARNGRLKRWIGLLAALPKRCVILSLTLAKASGTLTAACWRRLPRWLTSMEDARKLGLNALTVVAVLLLVASVGNVFLKKVLLIEPISVPKQLSERGYTAEVVAQRLFDEIRAIEQKIETYKQRSEFSLVSTDHVLPKIDLPVGGISVATFLSSVREWLNVSDTRIGGEIILLTAAPAEVDQATTREPTKFALRLRVTGAGAFHSGETTEPVDALFPSAALNIIEILDPYLAALHHEAQGNYADAIRMIDSCLRNDNAEDDKWALTLRAKILIAQSRVDDSIQQLESVNARFDDFSISRYNLAQVLISKASTLQDGGAQLQHFNRAFEAARDGVARDRNGLTRAKGSNNAAVALRHLGRFSEARSYYDSSIKSDPKAATYYYNAGMMYLDTKFLDYDEAIGFFQKTTEIDANHARANTNWGVALLERGKPGDRVEAERLAKKLIADAPSVAEGHDLQGRIHLADQAWAPAIEKFQKAVELDEKWATPRYNLGLAQHEAAQYDDAEKAFRKALELNSRHPLARVHWARTLAQVSKLRSGAAADLKRHEAIEKLRLAVEWRGGDGVVLTEIGKVYELLDLPQEASKAYEAAVQVDGARFGYLKREIARLKP